MARNTQESGFALLLAIVIASILLSIGLTILTITVKQLTLSSTARESEIAFHASSAGVECLRFHRDKNVSSSFTNEVTNLGTAPTINCFGLTSDTSDIQDQLHSNSDGYINEFHYEFDWAGNSRCSQLDMYVMVADGGEYTYDYGFLSTAVGSKTCPEGGTCNIAIVRGYNRSCTDLHNGLATVERELTLQF